MDYHLEIKEEARQDIINGYLWYEEKQLGLGQRFSVEVFDYLKYISNYPEHFQVKRKSYREAVLKTFPFVIVYEIMNNAVVVFAVFPTRMNPKRKRN